MKELTNIKWVKPDDGKWLAYDDNNTQITGWLHDLNRDTWYYCYSDNIATGWFKDKDDRWYYFFDKQCVDYGKQMYLGEMKIGWLKDSNGKWYYLLPKSIPSEGIYKGQCIIDTELEIDGVEYEFNEYGEWIEETEGVSNKGIDFIKSFEGYYAEPYYDIVNIKTLGYGMTGKEIEGLTYVTEEQATKMLKDLVNKKYYPPIKKALDNKGITLSQNKIDALVSMAYNIGYMGVLNSTLFKNICNGITDENTITNNFCSWSMAGGKQVYGLLRRRQAEAKIFLYGEYNNN